MCIAGIENIELTPERSCAMAIPKLKIERKNQRLKFYPEKPWSFRAVWGHMLLNNNSITVPYAGWSI